MIFSRRGFLRTGLLGTILTGVSSAFAQIQSVECLMRQNETAFETNDSPFYTHYHMLAIPVQVLIKPPAEGVVLKTAPVDQGSYDIEGFKKFIASSGLKADSLQKHDHDVTFTKEQLERIAQGEKDVEIRVISKKGNYVHNFLITASPGVLAKIRKKRA